MFDKNIFNYAKMICNFELEIEFNVDISNHSFLDPAKTATKTCMHGYAMLHVTNM